MQKIFYASALASVSIKNNTKMVDNFQTKQKQLNISTLPAGLYLMDIQSGAGRVTQKLIMEK